MSELAIQLTGANGDTIVFDADNYILIDGVRGFGIPYSEVRIDPTSGDGGVWRSSRRGVREIDLPVTILGNDRADVQAKLRRLSQLLQDRNGATRVTVTYPDETSLFLDTHYVGGAESQYGTDGRGHFIKWVLTLQAPQPFWQTSNELSFTIGTGSTGRSLLPLLTKLRVTSTQTLGYITITNAGDVTVQPKWVIKGPVEQLVITNGTQSFSFPGEIFTGETYTVDTATGEVTNQLGENIYAELGTAPKFFGIPPGTSSAQVNGLNATPDTEIICYYSPRYEVVH
jgi:phage-related protein